MEFYCAIFMNITNKIGNNLVLQFFLSQGLEIENIFKDIQIFY